MVVHLFGFKWRTGVTEEVTKRVAREIAALQGEIPGLLETYVGVNFSPRSLGYAFGGVMKFVDRAALEAYQIHPAHRRLVDWLMPLVEAVELDFER